MGKFIFVVLLLFALMFILRILPRLLKIFTLNSSLNRREAEKNKPQEHSKYDKSKIVDADFEEIN